MKSSVYTVTKGDQMGQIRFHVCKSIFGFYPKSKPCYSTFRSQSQLSHVNCGGFRWFFRFLSLGITTFTLLEEWVDPHRGSQNFSLYRPTAQAPHCGGMFCSLPQSALYHPHILGPSWFEILKHYKTIHYIVGDKPYYLSILCNIYFKKFCWSVSSEHPKRNFALNDDLLFESVQKKTHL